MIDPRLEKAIADHGAILSFESSRAGEIILGEAKKELESLKDNADANTVAELKELKGYKRGLLFALGIVNQVKRTGEVAKEQLEKQRIRDAKNQGPIDSSTL